MSFEAYAALKGVNWSSLKRMADSPLAYHYHLTAAGTDSPAMATGRLIHTAVLEPDRLPLDYAVWDGGRRGTNDYKAFVEQQGARQIVTASEYQNALEVRDAVRRHRKARRLLRYGRPEVTLQWVDSETRIRCKARLDWLAGDVMTDLKSTTTVEARSFGRTAARLDYPGQLGFYRMGLLATGHELAPVHIVAVEQDRPHDVAVFRLSDDVLDAGEDVARGLLRRLKGCRRRRRWPGRYEDVEFLDIPPWYFDGSGDEIQILEGLRPGRSA